MRQSGFWILLVHGVLAVTSFAAQHVEPIKFSFGKSPTAGFTFVPADSIYASSTGFGFEPGSQVVAQESFVTSDRPFFFSARVLEGNYRVVLTLGDGAGDSCTTIKAESRRLMLEQIRTGKGEIMTREICVNVRTPRIGTRDTVRLKQQENELEMVTWDDKLTLEFNGPRPCLRSLEIAPAPELVTIFLAGDSTVCDQPQEPWNSWGQMLPRFFKPGVVVANYAQSGESVKSSLGARRFEKIFSLMKPADWLFIQFGHNDMKDKAPNTLATYKTNLEKIVTEVRMKGGIPVLVTSMERKAGVSEPTLGGYPDAVRAVAREENTALLDLNALSVVLYKALGTNLGKAFQDGTHHNNYGSYELAKCIAAALRQNQLGLANFLTEGALAFDPARPDPIEQFKVPPSPMSATRKPVGN